MKHLALALALAACACGPSAMPAASAADEASPAANVTTLAGTLGDAPFVAKSALLVQLNAPVTATSLQLPGQVFPAVWSTLFVFDRPMTCAEAPQSIVVPNVTRHLQFFVMGRWPLAKGITLPIGVDPSAPASPKFIGGSLRGLSGSDMTGTVRILHASATSALLAIDAETVTSGTPTSGALRGRLAVTVCP